MDAAGGAPLDRLQALARSYLSFIRSRPHVHDLAYGPAVAKRDHQLLQTAAITYWTLLRDTVQACQPPETSQEEVLRRCATFCGAVYGIARLSTFQQLPDSVPSDIDGLVATALDTLFTARAGRFLARGCRLDELIRAAAPATLYVCGGADNELELADRFTHVFLLEIDEATMLARLDARQHNEWGRPAGLPNTAAARSGRFRPAGAVASTSGAGSRARAAMHAAARSIGRVMAAR